MTRPAAAVVLALAAGAAAAFPPRPAPTAAPAPPPLPAPADTYDLVVLAPHRPIRVAVTLRVDDAPLADRWAAALKAVFAVLDRDRDGFLTAAEVRRVFSDTSAAGLLLHGTYAPFPDDTPTLPWLDADGDGRVSFAEFAGHYRQAAAAVVQLPPSPGENPQAAAATAELFKLLDRDGDGKLTRAEVAAAEILIASRDADEDECLSLFELVGDRPFAAPPAAARDAGPAAVARSGRFPDAFAARFARQYAGADGRFTPAGLALDPAAFARLDADGDGSLSPGEAGRWWTGPADVDVTLSFSAKAAGCRAVVTTPPAVLAAGGFSVAQSEPRRVVIRHGRQPIELAVTPAAGNRANPLRDNYLGMFDQATGKKGHVTDADLGGPMAPQYQLLRVLFDLADADADGKLTRAELIAQLDLFDTFAAGAVALTPAVQTPTLFQLLDDDRDGRLSVRELRTAWDRLAVLEPPGPGGRVDAITTAAIQPVATLRLGRPAERPAAAAEQGPPAARVPRAGPLWFRKMDRNGDGDVSRSEFLGTRSEFDAIDTDRDGLISRPEAEAFDAAARRPGNPLP